MPRTNRQLTRYWRRNKDENGQISFREAVENDTSLSRRQRNELLALCDEHEDIQIRSGPKDQANDLYARGRSDT